jgi:hypothetical protein
MEEKDEKSSANMAEEEKGKEVDLNSLFPWEGL